MTAEMNRKRRRSASAATESTRRAFARCRQSARRIECKIIWPEQNAAVTVHRRLVAMPDLSSLRKPAISLQFSYEIFLKKLLASHLVPSIVRFPKCLYSPGLGRWASTCGGRARRYRHFRVETLLRPRGCLQLLTADLRSQQGVDPEVFGALRSLNCSSSSESLAYCWC